jgi:hypothetical protein
MNAMPMTYALQLRKRGWDVTYFVDAPPGDQLSRPEHKFPGIIRYPYPAWILERPVMSPLLAALGPAFLFRDIIATLRRADVVFLSGFYLSLRRYLPPSQTVLFLSHGSDLHVWCDSTDVERLARLFATRIGAVSARFLVTRAVRRMVESLKQVTAVITFPPGLSEPGETILARELAGTNVARIARYDISFADLPRPGDVEHPGPSDTLRIVCGTRHTFRRHPGLSDEENKGTDVIIRGLARYARLGRRPLEVHFFRKGLDLAEARALCKSQGIEDNVTWHEELPFHDFLELHQRCDIAFDQLGSHWMGSGMYAMYLGMPVVTNSRKDVLEPFWGERSPLCHAQNEEDVVEWLVKLEDPMLRRELGVQSHRFAVAHFDDKLTMDAILSFVEQLPDCDGQSGIARRHVGS